VDVPAGLGDDKGSTGRYFAAVSYDYTRYKVYVHGGYNAGWGGFTTQMNS